MKYAPLLASLVVAIVPAFAWAGQVPGAASDADVPISHHDRVYAAEQFSNTVSVTDPVRQQAARRHSAGRTVTGEFQPAL